MKKKKTHTFLKDEADIKELQLYEAVSNRAILEPLEEEGLSLGELQNKIKQIKDVPIKKTTLATRISRLRTAGLVRKQSKQIDANEIRTPQYRGWRIKQQENGTYQAELGFELTENGKTALETIRSFTHQKTDLPLKTKITKKKGEKKKNE